MGDDDDGAGPSWNQKLWDWTWKSPVRKWVILGFGSILVGGLMWWMTQKQQKERLMALQALPPQHCSSEAIILVVVLVTPERFGLLKSFLEEIYVQAECRLRLRFGLVMEAKHVQALDMAHDTFVPKNQLQFVQVPPQEAHGDLCMLAHAYPRFLNYKSAEPPIFTLLMDMSVKYMERGWDTLCIDMWNEARQSLSHATATNVVVSGFPGVHTGSDHVVPTYLAVERLDPYLSLPVYTAKSVFAQPRGPMLSRFWTSRFSFGPSYIFEWHPFDPFFPQFSLAAYDFIMSVRFAMQKKVVVVHPNKVVAKTVLDMDLIPSSTRHYDPFQCGLYTMTEEATLEFNDSVQRLRLFFHCEPEITLAAEERHLRMWSGLIPYGFTMPHAQQHAKPKRGYYYDPMAEKKRDNNKGDSYPLVGYEKFMGVDVARGRLHAHARLGLSAPAKSAEAYAAQNSTTTTNQTDRASQHKEELACKFSSFLQFQQAWMKLMT